jgi:hypothetical protein
MLLIRLQRLIVGPVSGVAAFCLAMFAVGFLRPQRVTYRNLFESERDVELAYSRPFDDASTSADMATVVDAIFGQGEGTGAVFGTVSGHDLENDEVRGFSHGAPLYYLVLRGTLSQSEILGAAEVQGRGAGLSIIHRNDLEGLGERLRLVLQSTDRYVSRCFAQLVRDGGVRAESTHEDEGREAAWDLTGQMVRPGLRFDADLYDDPRGINCFEYSGNTVFPIRYGRDHLVLALHQMREVVRYRALELLATWLERHRVISGGDILRTLSRSPCGEVLCRD